MSGSEIESVNSGSSEEVIQFECRICKQHCTAAEKDSHRAMHNREKRKRARSPGESEVATLFQPVVSPSIPVSAEMERREALRRVVEESAKKKAEKREKSGKRRSKKNYNHNIEWETSSGS